MAEDIELVVFDLDGTLINLKVDWAELKQNMKSENDYETIEKYELENIADAEPIELTVKLAKKLKNEGKKLAIFSSNMRKTVEKALKILDLEVDFIVAREDVKNLKPAPEGLEKIAAKFKIAKDKIVYIGDRGIDKIAAEKASISFILI